MTLTAALTLEIMDVRHLHGGLRQTCRSHTYQDGWMRLMLDNYRRGWTYDTDWEQVPLKYPTGHAIIARIDQEFAGWAIIRHQPEGHSDFSVWTKAKFRGQRVATNLLLMAHDNFGVLDTYPHDFKSTKFYGKHEDLVVPFYTNSWNSEQFAERDVF